jgi:hypothetical protein
MKQQEAKFQENDKKVLAAQLLDEIGDALREKGVTLEALIESGREIRAELVKEKYGVAQEPEPK